MSDDGRDVVWPKKPGLTQCRRCQHVACYLPCNVCTLCLLLDPVMREGER